MTETTLGGPKRPIRAVCHGTLPRLISFSLASEHVIEHRRQKNMIYKVKAKVIEKTIGEFYRKLADGTVAQQRPDGEEITASCNQLGARSCGIDRARILCRKMFRRFSQPVNDDQFPFAADRRLRGGERAIANWIAALRSRMVT